HTKDRAHHGQQDRLTNPTEARGQRVARVQVPRRGTERQMELVGVLWQLRVFGPAGIRVEVASGVGVYADPERIDAARGILTAQLTVCIRSEAGTFEGDRVARLGGARVHPNRLPRSVAY